MELEYSCGCKVVFKDAKCDRILSNKNVQASLDTCDFHKTIIRTQKTLQDYAPTNNGSAQPA